MNMYWSMCSDRVCVCLFFFFKQKTAYEIYQCDWSSDVCSSDLLLSLPFHGGRRCIYVSFFSSYYIMVLTFKEFASVVPPSQSTTPELYFGVKSVRQSKIRTMSLLRFPNNLDRLFLPRKVLLRNYILTLYLYDKVKSGR